MKIVCISCDRESDLPEFNSSPVWQSKKFICPSCSAEQEVTIGETEWLVDVPGEARGNGMTGEFFRKVKIKFCATSGPRSSKVMIRFQTEDLPPNQRVIALGFP
jgi:hypothetical protein